MFTTVKGGLLALGSRLGSRGKADLFSMQEFFFRTVVQKLVCTKLLYIGKFSNLKKNSVKQAYIHKKKREKKYISKCRYAHVHVHVYTYDLCTCIHMCRVGTCYYTNARGAFTPYAHHMRKIFFYTQKRGIGPSKHIISKLG